MEGAAQALRGVIAIPEEARPATEPRAVTKAAFAAIDSCTREHVAHLMKRGEIPSDAVLGSGRGQRVIVDAAIAALRRKPTSDSPHADCIEAAGAAYVRRRRQLRIVRGSR